MSDGREKRQGLRGVAKSSRDSWGEKTVVSEGVTPLLSTLTWSSGAERGMAKETKRVGKYNFERSLGDFFTHAR